MNQLVVDNPKGYVCRLSRFPEELCEFIELIKPIFRIIYGTKIQMENALTTIKSKKANDGVLNYGFKKPTSIVSIPACFTPIPTQRKRKPGVSNLNANSSSSSKK